MKGEGCLAFLQGLVTQDTQLLNSRKSIASLFLNAKGRIISDALIVNSAAGEVMIDVPSVNQDAVANLLSRHKLRRPLSIDKSDSSVCVSNESLESSFQDPRVPSLPFRSIQLDRQVKDNHENIDYKRKRLLAGVVEGQDLGSDAIPIFYNFDLFNCISFNKGCYSGQELITRTIRRGVVRRRIVPLRTADGSLMKSGADVCVDSRVIGSVFVTAQDVGLALLQLDSASGMNERDSYFCALDGINNITVEGVAANVVAPKYL